MDTKLKERFIKIVSHPRTLPFLLVVIGVVISLQNIHLGVWEYNKQDYTHYNNYVIFKYSFKHLIEYTNLYVSYGDEYADLYKYSPTFAFFMGLFAWIPDVAGLIIWNLLNLFVFFFAVKTLNLNDSRKNALLVLFVFFELILTTENSQSNALMAGLMILSFNLFEKDKPTLATLCIALGAFIKIYSVVGCLLLLLYPGRLKSAMTLALWVIVLFALPLCVVSFTDLIAQYQNWYVLLKADESQSLGMSAYLYMNALVPNSLAKPVTQGLGLILLLVPAFMRKSYTDPVFRVFYFSMILIWMVIFNHKAESPTYIIAMSGVGTWYFVSETTAFQKILFFSTLFFTSLWFTDLIPRAYKDSVIDSHYIKPLFPLIILLVIFYSLFQRRYRFKTQTDLQ